MPVFKLIMKLHTVTCTCKTCFVSILCILATFREKLNKMPLYQVLYNNYYVCCCFSEVVTASIYTAVHQFKKSQILKKSDSTV